MEFNIVSSELAELNIHTQTTISYSADHSATGETSVIMRQDILQPMARMMSETNVIRAKE
jgi:hypothetical protein